MLVGLKKQFLESFGVTGWHLNYPIADQIFETAYVTEQFSQYLINNKITYFDAKKWLEEMIPYSGQYFKPTDPMASLKNWRDRSLAKFAEH
jgi:hypothetical protein